MRATPKLIYPSYLRVFVAAIACLFLLGNEGKESFVGPVSIHLRLQH
jgi:hypothetical protein